MPQATIPPIKDIVLKTDDPQLVNILKDIKLTLDVREGRLGDTANRFIDYYEFLVLVAELLGIGTLTMAELSADPSDPIEGNSVLWQSDGTGSGDDGDIMIKITAGTVTKTITLVDFSAF